MKEYIAQETQQVFVEVIDFACHHWCEEPKLFLQLWMEGEFDKVKEYWPEFTRYLGEEE